MKFRLLWARAATSQPAPRCVPLMRCVGSGGQEPDQSAPLTVGQGWGLGAVTVLTWLVTTSPHYTTALNTLGQSTPPPVSFSPLTLINTRGRRFRYQHLLVVFHSWGEERGCKTQYMSWADGTRVERRAGAWDPSVFPATRPRQWWRYSGVCSLKCSLQ